DSSRPSLQAHAQQQRAVGPLDDVARTHRRRSWGELLAGDTRPLPGLPSVYGAMQITVRHAILVVEVLRQQVTGGKQRPVAGTRQPLLAADQVLASFALAPRLSAIAGAPQAGPPADLALVLLLEQRHHDQVAAGQERQARLVPQPDGNALGGELPCPESLRV